MISPTFCPPNIRALPIPILILVAEALTIDMKLAEETNRRGKHVI